VKIIAKERPFKNREEVKNIISRCNMVGGFLAILGVIFALVGVIGDAININVILESSNWLLLAILFVIGSFGPMLNSIMAKHLYGIESENKK
jgi:hypothetical protein